MTENFGRALRFVMRWEGGLSKNPNDPGGTTKWGISQRAYPDLDIENLTSKEAAHIYLEDYWKKAGCDTLPYPFDVLCFDTAVNMGVGRASAILAKSKTAKDFLLNRIESYSRMKSFAIFGKGWINRTLGLRSFLE